MKTMRAIVKETPGEGLQVREVPVPEPGPGEVLIRILKTSICGTDLHIYNWDEWAQSTLKLPLIIGHEFAGRVVGLGGDRQDLKEGDLVSGEGHLVCGRCRNCLAGRRHLCAHTIGLGVNRDGVFADFISLPEENVWRADPPVPTNILSCFDPLGNAAHAALSFDLVGEDVLITGAGPVGLMATAIARHIGARNIVATDLNPYRLELARTMGATLALDARREKVSDAQRQLGMKEGFDVGLEMSGSATALDEMLGNMIHGGKIALLGILPSGAGVDWQKVIFSSLTLQGIYGRHIFETWYKVTAMLESGLDVAPVVTHEFAADDFERGFELMRSGQCAKVLLDWA